MISLVNEFSAILDTCVLLPISLCDLLLQLAEDPALYRPRWCPEILGELERNLMAPKFNLPVEKARYRIACMASAFPEAMNGRRYTGFRDYEMAASAIHFASLNAHLKGVELR